MNNAPNKPQAMSELESELWQTAVTHAREAFTATGELSALLLSIHPHTKEIAGAPLAGLSKADVSALIGQISGMAPCVMITEAWMSVYPNSPELVKAIQEGNDAVAPAPRNDPQRKEVLAVVLHHRGRTIHAHAVITREQGKPPTLAPDWTILDSADTRATLRETSFGDTTKQRLI